MVEMNQQIQKYFSDIDKGIAVCYDVANKARQKGFDPDTKVEIPLAKNMAERVEGLIAVVCPQIRNSGLSQRIRELELKYGSQNWRVAFLISEEIANEKFCKFKDKKEAIEVSLRAGLAYITNGVVSSPLEGFIRLELKKRKDDGREYFCLYFGGPIRSAGTTATCIFLAVCDYIRMKTGYAVYDPTEEEIKRTFSELEHFHDRITNLQYYPSEREAAFITRHLPIQIDGDASEKIDVPNYKDLPRVSTNKLRNGFCLVMAEGLCQKFAKFWSKFSKWYTEMGMDHWKFLDDYVALQKEIKSKGTVKKDTSAKVTPDYTYIKDLVAGRPVLGYPLRIGAFRVRFGRARTAGLSDDAIHPATMVALDNFIAYGTQLKTERPGKSTTISSCDSLEGPIVKLKNGDVLLLETESQARQVVKDIQEIIFMGDILINYGYFLNRGHILAPVGYCEEWYALELEKALGENKGIYTDLIKNPNKIKISCEAAIAISKEYSIPLHPRYTFHFADLSHEQFIDLLDWLNYAVVKDDKIILPITVLKSPKRILELIGCPHIFANNEYVVIEGNWALALRVSLGFYSQEFNLENIKKEISNELPILDIINKISEVKIRNKSGLYIGSRMGRPEKAKMRKLTGSPHALFPVGAEGGRLRCFQAALESGKVTADFSNLFCKNCNSNTVYPHCHKCGQETIKKFICKECSDTTGNCKHESSIAFSKQEIKIQEYFQDALKKLGTNNYPELIKGVRGTSNKEHIPEHLLKGILRSIHNIHVNKDGTTRYDMIEMSLTHFKPKEIGTDIEKLKSLGYTHDVYGNELTNDEQILELRCQDLVLPSCPESLDEGCDFILSRVANFIDDLMEKLYGMPRFYNLKKKEELVGHLVVGLSPHTAAGIVGRIIGFSKTQAMLANPLFHSIMRRDCVHPNTKLLFFDKENSLNYNKIGKFVDELIEKGCKTKVIDMVGTKAVYPNQEYYTYGADPNTKLLVKKKIKYFIKGPKTQKWVKITTSTNREFAMTPTHDFMCLDENNKIKSKKAKEIVVGDKTLVMDYLEFPIKNIEKLDLIKELIEKLPENIKNKFRIINCTDFFKNLVKINGRDKIISVINSSKSIIQNLNRWYKAIPLNHIEKLILENIISYENLPENSKIKYWFSNKSFDRFLNINLDLCRLLGTYTAEGHCRENKTTRQVSFRICHPILGNDTYDRIKRVFNIISALEENNTKITISHSLVYYLFKYILGTGFNAKNKKVPQIIYSLKDNLVSEYISGYVDGDGSIDPEDLIIHFYSANRSLLDDFALLISRFHAIGRYVKIPPRLPGKTVLYKYLELGHKPKKFGLFHLVFRGEDANILSSKLSLYHPEKELKANYLLQKEYGEKLIKVNNHLIAIKSFGDSFIDYIKNVEIIEDEKNSYCVEVEWNKKEERSVVWGEQIINFRCDGDEATVMLLMDALLNFSPKLLSDHRGATQDEPLVLTSMILPTEVDDMVFDMDIVWKYPLELYEASLQYKPAYEIPIKTLKSELGKEGQYAGWGFTHDTDNFNAGVRCSSYKTIPTMQEKVEKQMILSEKIRAIDISDVARLIIERHFIRDIKGNLRKFSQQQFRCVSCNDKYRRPPLKGNCISCGGKILFTISHGSIIKYLDASLMLAEKYAVPSYLKQTLDLAKQRIEMLFGKEKEKQEGLTRWFS